MATDEQALQRMAKEYQTTEQQKGLRWFPFVGEPVPSEEEVDRVRVLRQAAIDADAADRRRVDRHRDVVEGSPTAFINADEHPAFGQPAEDRVEPDGYAPPAAEAVVQKKLLHGKFTDGLWLMLGRMRAERRLQAMARAQRNRQHQQVQQAAAERLGRAGATTAPAATRNNNKPAAPPGTTPGGRGGAHRGVGSNTKPTTAGAQTDVVTTSSGDDPVWAIGLSNVTLLELPALPPTGETAGGGAAPSAAGGGGTAALKLEAPLIADGEAFHEKELKVPFEFKLKHYTRMPLTVHHAVTCDPPETLANFPAGPLEAAEMDAEAVGAPSILDTFAQPPVTLEMFPGFEFSFHRAAPQRGLVRGTAPQPVNNGGFHDPCHRLDYHPPLPSRAPPQDAVRRRVIQTALPRPMRKLDTVDDVSDDDGEESEVVLPKPVSLASIASTFLPTFQPPPAPSAAPTGGPPAHLQQPRRSQGRALSEANALQPAASVAVEPAPLAPERRPIHAVGMVPVNAPVRDRLQAAAAALQSLRVTLPAPQQVAF